MADAKKSEVAAAILKQLKDPFKPELVKYTKLGGNKLVAYVDARDVMKRLDEVMGTENWADNYVRTDGGFVCELSLRINGEWITKSGVSNDTKIAPQKGGESGAFKRAAVKFGVSRYLYYFDPLKWTPNNIEDWPTIFKPGAPENWEEVAEKDYGLVEGMDSEEAMASALDVAAEIHAAETKEQLAEIIKKMSSDEQRIFENLIANKTAELVRGTDDEA